MLKEVVGKQLGLLNKEACLEGGIEWDFLGQNHSLQISAGKKMAQWVSLPTTFRSF